MSSIIKNAGRYSPLGLLIAVILVTAGIAVCSAAESSDSSSDVEKVEVYHFHLTRQCYSCIRLGELAEETVEKYFADELASGKVVFGHVTVDDPADADIVRKYKASGSSLMIGVYTPSGFSAEEDIKVWYKIGKPEEYESYLKDLIEKRLSGSMN